MSLPLVEPAPELPPGEAERAARQLRLPEMGELAQRRLYAAKIAVMGAGGLGAPVLLYLASAGIGTIGIVDDDRVDRSNLQRQVIFGVDDVGRPKSEVAAERIRALSPHTRVVRHAGHLTAENAAEFFDGYDLVIDGSDTFDTRYAVADACAQLGIPLVWGSVLRFDAQATVFWSAPHDGPGVTLRDVFPDAPAPGEVPSCAEAGVLGAVCGQLGGILVTEAVKLVCGIGDDLVGRMLVLDGLTARLREVPLRPTARSATPAEADAGTESDVGTESGDGSTQNGAPADDLATRPTRGAPRRVAVDELDDLRRSRPDATLLDVREPDEVARGAIPGAQCVPLAQVLADPAAVDAGDPLVVFCQQGPRARAAIRALAAQRPASDIRLLDGGYAAWEEYRDRHREEQNA